MVAAYSWLALVPLSKPPVIRLLTTQKERRIRMPYEKGNVTQLTKILSSCWVTVVAGLVALLPAWRAVGFLMPQPAAESGAELPGARPPRTCLQTSHHLLLGLTVAGQMRLLTSSSGLIHGYHGAGSCGLYL